jgi:hypothetical protein
MSRVLDVIYLPRYYDLACSLWAQCGITSKSVGTLTLLSITLGLNDTSPDVQLTLLVGHPAAGAGMKI